MKRQVAFTLRFDPAFYEQIKAVSASGGRSVTSFIKCEQILTISKECLIRCVGRLENERLKTVAAAIRRVLEV